jgi:putative ubiquitin-RnfH superfamily antitoxin RatB of RatAB toxin-antitoxin module
MRYTVSADTITVEVAYARSDKQLILTVTGEAGMTLLEAATRSGITEHFPEIDLATAKMGIFSKLEKPDTVLNEGDRVEIYRELIADPKAARKNKAAAAKGAAARKKAVPPKKAADQDPES